MQKKFKKFKTVYTNLVREPKLVVKSGRGARATATAAEAVAEQRRRANGIVPSTTNARKRKSLKNIHL